MIVFGIASTSDADIAGHIVLPGAIDLAQRDVPLFREHQHPIGRVLQLHAAGNRIYVEAETDDIAATRLGYFSVAGRALERTQRADGMWAVSKMRLQEISLTPRPCNPACKVIEVRATDPLHELHKANSQQHDLFIAAFGAFERTLREVSRHVGQYQNRQGQTSFIPQ